MPDHQVTIDGLTLPARLAGHPALEFCNTWAGWNGTPQRDYLESYDHLALWSELVGLLAPGRVASLRAAARDAPSAARAELERARRLRTHCYRIARDPAGDQRAFTALAAEVEAAAGALRLHRTGRALGPTAPAPALLGLAPEVGLAAPVLAAAWSAGQLLVGTEVGQVSTCPGHGCGWLFLNPTGRRRWCTMTTCGNRAKVRRFAERRSGAQRGDE